MIQSFTYQSGNITFSEWASLYTLCLAPLIAHVASGVPPPSYLSATRPRWHDTMCLYNPTTIIWRYFGIANRRLRSKSWDASNLAAANAVFWTDRGWDGSDGMIDRSEPFCNRLPEGTRVAILSWSTVKTVIISLQGAQALYSLLTTFQASIDKIFFPLALIGLLRLWSFLWIVEDYSFVYREPEPTPADETNAELKVKTIPNQSTTASNTARQLLPPTGTRSRIFQVGFMIPVLGLLGLAAKFELPTSPDQLYTVSSFLMGLFYLWFLTISALVYGYYFINGKADTTIVPCISSVWYKIYSGLVMVFVVFMITMVSLETTNTSCGIYTTLADSATRDHDVCS